MELIQKFKEWKEYNDKYQVHVKISSVESSDVDKKVICMEDLEKRKEIFGICAECDEPGTGKGWCRPCNAKRFKKNFKDWTSGNKEIDELIQHSQLYAVHCTKCLEWIPYEKFQNITHITDGDFSNIYSATWQEGYICYWDIEKHDWKRIPEQVALKVVNISSEYTNFLNEVKSFLQIYVSNIVQCYGITQDPNTENYAIVLKYCRDGNMRNYLNQHENHISCELKIDHLLHISRGLLHIHNSDIIHRDLHSGNILFDGTPYISGLGSCQPVNYKGQIIVYGILPYVAPEVLRRYEYTKAADIYSFGIVMNEFMSEETPYNDDSNDQIYLTVNICKGSRPKISEYTPKLLANLVTKCWDSDPDERPTIQEVVTTLKAMTLKNLSSKQQIIQQFKLNYGLFLDGYSIKPSEQAVLSEDGDLDISLYEGQPLVYTFVNDRDSHINLLSFNSGDNSIEFNEGLQSSDISINFPVAEITYSTDDLLVNFMESETYGHLFAKKILVGGKLFISDLISATSTQTDSFKFFLTWVYDSAKYSKENPFNNLIGSNFLAKIRTLDGKDLNTCGKLTNWMNNLYQNDVIDIISYNNLIPISKLRSIASSLLDEIDEKQPGVANFREKLSFYEWIGNSSYTNLTKWINEKHLIYGLIINKHFELEISKKIAINFINIPSVDSSTKFYLKIINPTRRLEEFLISNNIFSTENVKNIRSFPFTKRFTEIKSCKDYAHFLIKFEKYKIRFDNLIPSKGFKQAIENALENMKPFTHLQNVFDEYGHFFPLNVVLGKSLKTILPNFSLSYISEEIELKSAPFESLIESLNSHLDRLNITYILTTKGSVIEKSDLSNWIQNTDEFLEIIEFDNVISLYDVLEEEQKRKIDVILNKKDNLRIIMTGIEELKDLDVNNIEHYKRINIKPSLEDENYEVFGSVISKNNLKLENILIAFELYDLNGFSAMIKNLNRDVDITACYILWIIIGNPSKLSIFSPRNREFQVDCIKKSITLQPNNFYYSIKSFYKLSEGCTISVNVYCSTANYEPINIKIKFVGWSEDCIYFKIAESNYNNSNLNNSSNSSKNHGQPDDDTDVLINFEVTICILSPHHEKLNIDNREKAKYSLSLIGHDLTENTKVIPFTSVDELGPDQIKYLQKMEASINRFDDDVGPLKLSDYEMNENEIPRKNGRISKWVSVKNKGQEFAFKSIFNKEHQRIIQSQVPILKKLNSCNNIIKFYGLVPDGNKWYLVTEWAEYGNLREFYTNHKERFDLRSKLRMSLDIACGLKFLRDIEILHHDIRAENILITLNETAKLTSHSLDTIKLRQAQNLEQARYYAPELLWRNSNTKYDFKCEIYSFGILLWEIAEEKTPYENYNDIIEIINFVDSKSQEPFSRSSQMPEKFKNLVLNAINHNPESRPKITKILEVLNNCFEMFNPNYFHISKMLQTKYLNNNFSISLKVLIGEGTEKDLEKAFYLYQKTAENGDEKAMFNLANCYINGKGTEKNLVKAFYWYQKAAENGHIKAMFNLAMYYKNGEGAEKNLEKTFYWYQKAAEKNHIKAMFNLAICYKNGEGTEKNLEKAFHWYHKVAEKDHIKAMINLVKCYDDGIGTEKNLDKAIYWYQKAVKNGYTNAIFNITNSYKNGEETEKNIEKAFFWYQKAAEDGYTDAMFNLANSYKNGEGTEKNLEKAFFWYQKAAENGNEDAMFNLAICYINEKGTEKNLEKAFYWYQKAVEHGYTDAMFNLAICYKNGEGTEMNLEKAFFWYQKAAENGYADAMFNLAICYKNGKGTEKNLEKAFYWYQKAVERDHIKAMFNLAVCYEDGEGTEKNLEKAFYWYQKVAKNGNKDAMFNLAKCYENGKGTEKNLEKVFYWYKKAAENGYTDAMFKLANSYYNGKETEKNLEKAFHWYHKAAENGYTDAMFNLAVHYRNGEGTERNLEKAFYWHQKIVENNKTNYKNEVEFCNECKLPFTDYQWCQQCNTKHFQQDFSKWTSENEFIDKFIQETQINAKNSYEILEWIPYNKLSKINYYNKGGFSKIYKAIWSDGPIFSWNFDKQQWNRQMNYEVILKIFNNSSSLNNRLLDEWKYHYNCQKKSFSKFIQFFGFTQNPNNLDYVIVMSYAKKGSLRKCLSDIIKFKWQERLNLLKNIVLGLKVIHESNLIHGDFHDGNILVSDNYNELFIIDLGLCKPISDLQDSDNNEIYGVLPYIAPEILRKKPHTQASDIYSFSMIMWEFTSGIPPFNHEATDRDLILDICNKEKRPEIIKNTPKCYMDLMKKCWDSNPSNRPTIIMLEYIISEWIRCINAYYEINRDGNYNYVVPNINNQLGNDLLEFVTADKALVQEQANTSIIYYHPQACYTSRKLNEIYVQEESQGFDCMIED